MSTRRSRPTATTSRSPSVSPPLTRGNTLWQRDLSISYAKVGDVLEAQGKLDEALKAFRDSPDSLADGLAAADRRNTQWQRDLSVSTRRSAT